ncbi:TPA: hypothetical protein ACJCXE_004194 [Yersinia enterocolitica]
MSKIERYAGNLRAFGSNAQGLERTLFGETTQADDLTSQVTSSFLRGWGIVGPSENPSMEDFNAAMYTMSQFIAYQHQMGIPEWDALQEYYSGSICVRNGEAYLSLVDSNIGSAPPSAKWTSVLTAKNALANISGFLKSANNLSEIAASGSAAQAVAQANIGVTGGLGASVIGRLIAKRSITSTGVIPKATGAKWAIIRAWSAGGGGGGAGRTVTAGNASQGWAGQSGSFIELLVDVSGLSNYDCSIGLGGTGGAASNVNAGNPGLDGGSTIIAGILSCPGGKGGQPGVIGTTNNTGIAIVGTALPTATLGTILDSSVSDIGAPGSQVGTGPNQSLGCRGGSAPGGLGSVGGQAGRPIDAGTDGTGGDGKGHAAGGGGGSSVSNTTGYGGGNGTSGFISITEFA